MTGRHGLHSSRVGRHRICARVAAPLDAGPHDVVLVHGLGVSSRYLVPLLEQLGGEVRCWAPDLPGHGRSSRPTRTLSLVELVDVLACWLEATNIRSPLLVANSYGCQLVAELALRGVHVRGLVLVGAVTDQRRRSAAQQVARLLADQYHEPPRLAAMQSLEYLLTGPLRTVAEFRDSQRHDLRTALARVPGHVALVRGELDHISPRDWNEQLVRARPDARLVEVPGVGHCAHYVAPQAVARVARTLLG